MIAAADAPTGVVRLPMPPPAAVAFALCGVVLALWLADHAIGNTVLSVDLAVEGASSSDSLQVFMLQTNAFDEGHSIRRSLAVRSSEHIEINVNRPKRSLWQTIRLDPCEECTQVRIGRISLLRERLFVTRSVELSAAWLLEHTRQWQDVGTPQIVGDRLVVDVTGPDPALTIDLPEAHRSPSGRGLAIVLIGGLLGLAAWFVTRPLLDVPEGRLAVYGIFLLLFVCKALQFSHITRVGWTPDEMAHIGNVAYMDTHSPFDFDRAEIKALRQSGEPGPNNSLISHPMYYYELMSWLAPRVSAQRGEGFRHAVIDALRSANIVLFVLGLAAFLLVAAQFEWSLLTHAAVAAYMTGVVSMPVLGAGVNNDNLLFLALGFFTLATWHWYKALSLGAYAMMGVTVCLALMSKVNGGLIGVVALGLATIDSWADVKRAFREVSRRRLVLYSFSVAPIVVLAAWDFVLNYARYGALMVPWEIVAPAEMQASTEIGKSESIYALGAYTSWFITTWWHTFIGVLGHGTATAMRDVDASSSPYLWMWPLALAGIVVTLWRRDSSRAPLVLAAGTLVFAVMHFYLAYKGHQASGYLGGVQARYYFGGLPAFFMLTGGGMEALRRWGRAGQIVTSVLAVASIALIPWSYFWYTAGRC